MINIFDILAATRSLCIEESQETHSGLTHFKESLIVHYLSIKKSYSEVTQHLLRSGIHNVIKTKVEV